MNKIVGMTLMLTLSLAAEAREKFAGIYLDSSIPTSQIRIIKDDLAYLYNNPIKDVDSEFQTMTELPMVDGPHLFNWIYNRVKFVIGEDYSLRGKNAVTKKGHTFPSNPLPPSLLNRTNRYERISIMSNAGAELYLTGKLENVLKGIKLDNKSVFAPSPRVGIIQVGEGHFLERLLINKELQSEANKIKRLSTFFHEARHGDGHSEHVGFIHSKCPPGHPLSGFDACEAYSNGAYSIDAVATKTLLLNCRTCSIEDKTKLSATIADAYSRVVVRSHLKTEAQLLEEMATYQRVIDFYIGFITANPKGAEASIKELERLLKQMKECEAQLKELKTPVHPKRMDTKPEGPFEEVSVEKSSSLMKSSLEKK